MIPSDLVPCLWGRCARQKPIKVLRDEDQLSITPGALIEIFRTSAPAHARFPTTGTSGSAHPAPTKNVRQ